MTNLNEEMSKKNEALGKTMLACECDSCGSKFVYMPWLGGDIECNRCGSKIIITEKIVKSM